MAFIWYAFFRLFLHCRANKKLFSAPWLGCEGLPQPTQEDIERHTEILTVRFVAAKDGRPA